MPEQPLAEIVPVPVVDKGLLATYGLPTALLFAILGPLFGVMIWLMRAEISGNNADIARLDVKIEKLRDDVNFLSREVDLSCRPAKDQRTPESAP